jgi:hypothetical protein
VLFTRRRVQNTWCCTCREVALTSPCQREAIAVTRRMQRMVVELVSMSQTSHCVNSLLGVLAAARQVQDTRRCNCREVESSPPCQRKATCPVRHMQRMVVELVSMSQTSQGVTLLLESFLAAVEPSTKKHLHSPGGGIESALPTQSHLPCPSYRGARRESVHKLRTRSSNQRMSPFQTSCLIGSLKPSILTYLQVLKGFMEQEL